MKTYTITIACDHPEAEEFAEWLNEQGHIARVGSDTANWIDGERGADVFDDLWDNYCDQ